MRVRVWCACVDAAATTRPTQPVSSGPIATTIQGDGQAQKDQIATTSLCRPLPTSLCRPLPTTKGSWQAQAKVASAAAAHTSCSSGAIATKGGWQAQA